MKHACLLLFLLLVGFGATAQTTILSESFNVTSTTNTMPTGWTVNSTGRTTGCAGIDWNQVVSGGFVCSVNGTPQPNPSGQSGSGMAGYNSWDIDYGSTSDMATPSLDFSTPGSYTVSFWVFNQQTLFSNAHDSLKVYVNTTNSPAGGTLLYSNDPNYNTSPTGWTQYTYTIPASYAGTTNYIIFHAFSWWGQDVFIDDVEVVFTPPPPCSGTPATPTITTAALTAANPHCSGTTKTITASGVGLPTVAGIIYQWETSVSSTGPWSSVSGGSGATTLSYTTPTLTADAYYRVALTCTNSSATVYSSAYYVPVGAPQPGTISGLSTFCSGDTSTYSVTAVSGTTYTWTLPTGWAGVPSGNSIFVTPGSTAGAISVVASTSCGTSIPSTTTISPGSAPSSPGTILGNSDVCPNSAQTYTILPITGATSYIWTLPTGWTGASTTNSINLTSGTSGGTITVRAANGCGQSNASSLAVSILSSLATPAAISGPTSVCSGGPYTYEINSIPNALSYKWILPAGWSGTTTDTSITVFPTSSGTLSVTAQTTCVSSATKTLSVTVTATVKPTVTVSAPASAPCQNTAITFTATTTGSGSAPTYQWKKNGLDVTGLGNSYTSNTLASGDVITVTLTSTAACASPDTVTAQPVTATIIPAVTPGISINATPPLTICSGTEVTFTTTSNGGGSAPTYQWYKNGNPIALATGTSYADKTLSNKDTLTIQMTTNAVCATTPMAISNKAGVRVTEVVTPTVSITVSPSDVITAGQPVTFTATQTNGGSTPTYQWKKNGVNIPFETSDVYTSSTVRPGDHISVEMLSYAPCTTNDLVRSNEIVLKSVLGVGSVAGSWEGQISVYPNPSSGRFTIGASWAASNSGKRVTIEVINMLGQSVYRSEVVPTGSVWHSDVSLPEGLSNGRYTLRLSTEGMGATTPLILSR